jgi:hypothetical protein
MNFRTFFYTFVHVCHLVTSVNFSIQFFLLLFKMMI